MKKLDTLLIKIFIPPFILAMGVVMFVFTMQSMWKFIDDVIGKGATLGMIIEFVFYLSMGLIPMALPAGILLSSLYIMGNLSEKYELTSMKSAGISLWRIMRPLIVICLLISAFSFICSNYIVPKANLKFKTRLYNFKGQKLALSLEEGVFNDDFKNFAIRIDKKNEETDEIEGIMLYDHSVENRNRTKIIMANKGKIDMKSDERFMIMKLEDGRQYQEMEEAKGTKPTDPRKYPYLRIKYEKLEKYLDLKEFEMRDTDEDVFRDQGAMMSLRQLFYEMDTMHQKIDEKKKYLSASVNSYYHFVKTSDTTSFYISMVDSRNRKTPLTQSQNKYLPKRQPITKSKQDVEKAKAKSDNWRKNNPPDPQLLRPKAPNPKKAESIKKKQEKEKNKEKQKAKAKAKKLAAKGKIAKNKKKNNSPAPPTKINKDKLNGKPNTFSEILGDKHRENMRDRAAAATKAIKEKSDSYLIKIKNLETKWDRYNYEIHLKFSLAAACLVFLFIGAPLGAIIRKGGFGYPVLVGVLLFVIFVALNTVFKKLGESGTLTPLLAAWANVILFFIPCFFLTIGAVRDAKIMNMDAMEAWFKRLRIIKFFIGG